MEPTYRKILVKSSDDYPKEEGDYFCCRNGFRTFQHLIPYTGEKTFMREIDWYLLPEQPKEITDEMIDKEFPCDLTTLAQELKIPKNLMSAEMAAALKSIQESNLNKQIGAKWLRDKIK